MDGKMIAQVGLSVFKIILDLVVELTKKTGLSPEELRDRFVAERAKFLELSPEKIDELTRRVP